jgi:thymidylate synthase
MNKADTYFIEEAIELLTNGFNDKDFEVRPKWEDSMPAHTIKTFCRINRYNLAEGEFPILTLRNAPFKYAVKETLWIFQKKSNNIHDLDSHNWDSWADETGSIGKTYGYVAGEKYDYPEGFMDQVDNVLWCLKNRPMDRRMMIQLFRPEYIKQSGLPPCLCSYFFDVTEGKLNMTVVMRSCDFLAAAGAGQSDEIGMAILQYMLAQSSDLKVGELVVIKNNLHIYDRHADIVKEILGNPAKPAPKFWINPEVKNFYDFKPEDFKLIDYQYTKLTTKIPVAV